MADETKARLLRHNALYTAIETGHPSSLGAADFIDHCLTGFKRILPVHHWLIGLG